MKFIAVEDKGYLRIDNGCKSPYVHTMLRVLQSWARAPRKNKFFDILPHFRPQYVEHHFGIQKFYFPIFSHGAFLSSFYCNARRISYSVHMNAEYGFARFKTPRNRVHDCRVLLLTWHKRAQKADRVSPFYITAKSCITNAQGRAIKTGSFVTPFGILNSTRNRKFRAVIRK